MENEKVLEPRAQVVTGNGNGGGTSPVDKFLSETESVIAGFINNREKLVQVYNRIGTLLGLSAEPEAVPPARRYRGPSETTANAMERIAEMLASNPTEGYSRGEISQRLGIDTSIVGRVLLQLADDKRAVMRGDRRAARWFPARTSRS